MYVHPYARRNPSDGSTSAVSTNWYLTRVHLFLLCSPTCSFSFVLVPFIVACNNFGPAHGPCFQSVLHRRCLFNFSLTSCWPKSMSNMADPVTATWLNCAHCKFWTAPRHRNMAADGKRLKLSYLTHNNPTKKAQVKVIDSEFWRQHQRKL